MRPVRTREQQRRDQRKQILSAARKLLSKHGPDATTMTELAEAAGVARATLFNQFGSKHGLTDAITEEVLFGYVELLESALADKGSPTTVLTRQLFEKMGAGIERDRRFYRTVFREIAKLTLGLDEGGAGQGARQVAVNRLVQLLTRGQARRELSLAHSPEDLATAFDSLVFGTITHWLYDDVSQDLRGRMRRAADIFLGRVAVEDDAADLSASESA